MKSATMFVLSEDSPVKIVFDLDEAFETGAGYIDAFDKDGNHLHALERMKDGTYTDNF